MTDYFGIITKYFNDKLTFKSKSLCLYLICDTVVQWDSYSKIMYVGIEYTSE